MNRWHMLTGAAVLLMLSSMFIKSSGQTVTLVFHGRAVFSAVQWPSVAKCKQRYRDEIVMPACFGAGFAGVDCRAAAAGNFVSCIQQALPIKYNAFQKKVLQQCKWSIHKAGFYYSSLSPLCRGDHFCLSDENERQNRYTDQMTACLRTQGLVIETAHDPSNFGFPNYDLLLQLLQ